MSVSSARSVASLHRELAEDGAAPLPDVVAARPGAHGAASSAGGSARSSSPRRLSGDGVDVVPPRAGDDHLLVHRQRRHGPEGAVVAVARTARWRRSAPRDRRRRATASSTVARHAARDRQTRAAVTPRGRARAAPGSARRGTAWPTSCTPASAAPLPGRRAPRDRRGSRRSPSAARCPRRCPAWASRRHAEECRARAAGTPPAGRGAPSGRRLRC